MREAETIAALGGEVAGARARLVALAGDVIDDDIESRASGRRRVRDPTREHCGARERSIEHLRPVSRLGVESELKRLLRATKDDEFRNRNRKGADRRVAFFFFRRAGAPAATTSARRQEGWLTGQGRPALSRRETSNAFSFENETCVTDRTNVARRMASRAATIALGSESRASAAFAARDAAARARGGAGRMAIDAERVYADVWADSLETAQMGRSEESQACVISTKTPRRLLIRAAAGPARFRVGEDAQHGAGESCQS